MRNYAEFIQYFWTHGVIKIPLQMKEGMKSKISFGI